MRVLEFQSMNTTVVLAAAEAPGVDAALQTTRQFIEDCEQRFSRFIPASELSRLNRAAGQWHQVSADLIDMLVQSLAYHRETGGLFDPGILLALKRVGYDRSMEELRKYGASSLGSTAASERSPFSKLEVDAATGWVRLPPGMEIDLGGFAKGWIVEKAAERLSESTSGCAVSAGGDILLVGNAPEGTPWSVRVENPWEPEREVARFEIGPGAVATSSVVKRAWMQGGIARHHLIDPRTGEPAHADWASVTVFAPSLTMAEVYAKALLIGGAGEVARLISGRPEISYLAVGADGGLISSFENLEASYAHKHAPIQ